MARRFLVTRMTAAALAGVLVLTACATTEPEVETTRTAELADPELARQAAAMQKTILEGALAGGALGGGISVSVGNSDDAATGISIGGLLGASAGTYVALVQRRYARTNRRLEAIRTDLDRNSEEVAATIAVMRNVLAVQKAELAAAKTRSAGGTTPELEAEIAAARANLEEMERAVNGAASRQREFTEARGLVPVEGGGSAIDPELADLSRQIAEMRAIADDLATSL